MIPAGLTVVGIPESPRVETFRAAAQRQGWPAPTLVSWMQLLSADVPTDRGGIVRLESPGRNWSTERALLRRGWAGMNARGAAEASYDSIDPESLAELTEPVGRILAMRQWYLGWVEALDSSKTLFCDGAFFSPPSEVTVLFDKAACQSRLEEHRVPVPPCLGIPDCSDDVLAKMEAAGRRRVFLKACHGSSGSGIVALETSRGEVRAFSTVEIQRRKGSVLLYNRRPGRWVTGWHEVAPVVDAVCRQRGIIQVWIPKRGWKNRSIDLRVVTIGGRARHTVVRMSNGPLTNLQLHNSAGDADAFASQHPDALQAAHGAAEKAAAAFPRCLALGVDVVVSPDNRAWVVEVNAFGDFLTKCRFGGLTTYDLEIAEIGRHVSATGR